MYSTIIYVLNFNSNSINFKQLLTMEDLLDYNRFRIEAMQSEICDLKALLNTLETYCFELADVNCPAEYKRIVKQEIYNLKTN